MDEGMKWQQYPLVSMSAKGKLGLYSLSGKTSYHKISWSLEAARFGFRLFQLVWNLTGTSAAAPPRCLSNFIAIRSLHHPISRLRDFTRFGGKTSYRLVNRGSAGYISKLNFMPFIASDLSAKMQGVSEWLNLTAFLGTADSEVHIVHISRVITAYTLESLSSFP